MSQSFTGKSIDQLPKIDAMPTGTNALVIIDGVPYQYCFEENGTVEVSEKSKLSPFLKYVSDDQVCQFKPQVPSKIFEAAMYDDMECHYVRLRFLCPSGEVGCRLLTPYQPSKTINMDNSSESVICVEIEVVKKDENETDPCKWDAVIPQIPIGISIDALNQ